MDDNNNSLEPIVLGEIKEQKSSKPIFVIITFILLGAILLTLPIITGVLQDESNIIGRIYQSFFGNEEQGDRVIINNDTFHNLGAHTSIGFETVVLSNISLDGNTITYSLRNRTGDLDLDDDTLYFEIYGSTENLLGVVKLSGFINAEDQVLSFRFNNLRFNPAVSYMGRIQRLTDDDFPEVIINNNELTCRRSEEEFIYIFNNHELKNIRHNFINNNTSAENYLELFAFYRELSSRINDISNNQSTAAETDTGFDFTASINLNGITSEDLKNLGNSNYFMLNTSSKRVSFEMKAKGYDCK